MISIAFFERERGDWVWSSGEEVASAVAGRMQCAPNPVLFIPSQSDPMTCGVDTLIPELVSVVEYLVKHDCLPASELMGVIP